MSGKTENECARKPPNLFKRFIELMLFWVVLLHEASHKIVARILNYEATLIFSRKKLQLIELETGLRMNGFCHFEEGRKFKKEDLIKIAAAPFYVLITTAISLLILSLTLEDIPRVLVIFIATLLLLKLNGTKNDLRIIKEVKEHYAKGNKIIYSNYRFTIYED